MSAMDMFWAAPPVSRTLTAAAVVMSLAVHGGFVNFYWVVFLPYQVLKYTGLPQIWRLVTPFLLTGPKLSLLLDPYFLYTYGSQLETGAARFAQPGDFFIYIVFVGLMILLSGGLYLQGMVLLSPLTLALAYTAAQEDPNRQVTYFIVTFSMKWLPFAMLGLTFVMDSPQSAMLQATGLLAAHAYDFVTKIWPEHGGGQRYLNTPAFVQRWFALPAGTARTRSYGTAFTGAPSNPAARAAAAAPSGAGGWASGNSWGSRGTGRRLGEE